MTAPWPTRLAMREGLASALSSWGQSIMVIAATTYLMVGIGLANALDVSALAAAEREWIDAGGYAFIVEPASADGGALSVGACEQLSAVDGIVGSFAVSISDRAAYPSSAPGTQATWVQVSPGIYQFFGLSAQSSADVIVTAGIVDDIGLTDGEYTVMTVTSYDGTGTVRSAPVSVTTVDSPVLGDAIAGAYLSPELVSGDAQQCYVLTDAPHVDTIGAYLAAALATGSTAPAVVQPRLSANTYGLDFATVYGERVLGWAWTAGSLALVALWGALQFGRRTRMAIYATFGAHSRARLTMQLTEWVTLTGIGVVWGWAIGVTLAIGLGADIRIALAQVTMQIVAAWGAASIGAVLWGLSPVGTLLDALKDRN